jgi:alkanesulfonate monooxygenase SsuD/methylene tetrahydromethanopterin reductase-like flavin-dependent oxidoreductase (luciferase family)
MAHNAHSATCPLGWGSTLGAVKIGVVLPAAEVDGHGRTPGWPAIRSFALAAEARGIDSLWMFDHFFNRTAGGAVEGMHEAWTIVAAVAATTTRVEIGTLVVSTSFRNPGLLAKMAVTADVVSGGRMILGIGTGWHDPEYESFGYPTDHRVARFEEALAIIRPLLDGRTVTIEGRYYRVRDAVLAPVPDRRIPILVAAEGPRMLRTTARLADACNTAWYGLPDARLRAHMTALDSALLAEGRDPGSMIRTVGMSVRDPDAGIPDDGEVSFRGSVDQLARAIGAYSELGIDHLILEIEPKTEAALDRIADALNGRVRGH